MLAVTGVHSMIFKPVTHKIPLSRGLNNELQHAQIGGVSARMVAMVTSLLMWKGIDPHLLSRHQFPSSSISKEFEDTSQDKLNLTNSQKLAI